MTDPTQREPEESAASKAEILALRRRVDALEAECQRLSDEAGRFRAAEAEAEGLRGEVDRLRPLEAESERFAAEVDRLRAEDARNRRIAETIDDVVWVLDMDLRYVYVSPSVRKFRGYTPEEAQALSLQESLTPDSYTRARDALQEERAREETGANPQRSRSLELEFRTKDGRIASGEARMSFLRDEHGRPTGPGDHSGYQRTQGAGATAPGKRGRIPPARRQRLRHDLPA